MTIFYCVYYAISPENLVHMVSNNIGVLTKYILLINIKLLVQNVGKVCLHVCYDFA